ncbi:unnamed protein product [Pleuronectes platessa]|uniref:Uncharacterized protein n=1 Tax=Pleuronectes platessa TaxID=8262 RepID=A0A9N7Z5C3_PLEPL|nr:unnamed protein product [Pleuronectes platessa]
MDPLFKTEVHIPFLPLQSTLSLMCSTDVYRRRLDPHDQCISNSPASPSQSPSPRYLPPPQSQPPALQMSGRVLRSSILTPPRVLYNVMLSLGKGSTLTCREKWAG